MAEVYTTQQGDMVDLIAFIKLGGKKGSTEALLLANPGLAALGPILPEGTKVTIPEAPPEPTPTVTRLWGDAS